MYVIDNWLKGSRNFFTGRAIYETFAKDKHVLDLLSQGKTPFAEDILLKCLTDINTKPVEKVITKPKQQVEEMPDDDDPVIISIKAEWMRPYQEMNYLRHSLDQLRGNNPAIQKQREPICLKILELEQECMMAWEKRDHYKQNGRLPDVFQKETPLPTDPLELGKLIESIKKNIRRNRKLMQEHTDKPVYAQKYNHYKHEYDHATGKQYEEKD